MAVDIHGPFAGAGSIVAARRGIVADKRDNNSGIVSLVFDVLHISTIGEVVDTTAGTAILVFGLEENNRPSIRDLGLGNCSTNICHVARKHVNWHALFIRTSRATYLSVALRYDSSLVRRVPFTRCNQPGKPPPDDSALI
jgi:hypothetical protein